MKGTVVLAALLVAACADAARAAPLPVVIEKLNAAANACGIAEPRLERVATDTLETSQFQPDPDAGGWLNMRVTVSHTRRGACTVRISVQMKAYRKPLPSGAVPKPKQRSRGPVAVLCNKSGDYSAPKDRFSLEVESAMEYLIRQCLSSLKY